MISRNESALECLRARVNRLRTLGTLLAERHATGNRAGTEWERFRYAGKFHRAVFNPGRDQFFQNIGFEAIRLFLRRRCDERSRFQPPNATLVKPGFGFRPELIAVAAEVIDHHPTANYGQIDARRFRPGGKSSDLRRLRKYTAAAIL